VAITHIFGGTPDTETRIRHWLGQIPTGFQITNQGAAGTVYSSGTKATRHHIYLKSSVAGLTVDLEVF